MPRLIVGLGNPGEAYAHTRHNAGFWLLDKIAEAQQAAFSYKRKFDGDVAALESSCRLLKPRTFMNHSGRSVAALCRYYAIEVEDILVCHDEVDLPVGAVKLKRSGGDAGHNGLADISRHLGAAYWRLRIGVGRQNFGDVADYVLRTPPADERQQIDGSLQRILDGWQWLAADDYNNAMTLLHTANP